jgi:Na+-driven multidrug efflux pump
VLVSSLSSAGLYLAGRENIAAAGLARGPNSLRRIFIQVGMGLGAVIAVLAWPVAIMASPDPAVQHVATVLILSVSALTPIAAWAYANVTILRASKRTSSDFISNTAAVWLSQIPLALIGCLLFGVAGAFIGLASYWLCRALITQRQVNRNLEPQDAQPARR